MHPENRGERKYRADCVAQKAKRGFPGERIGVYRKTRKFCSNPFCCGNARSIRGAYRPTMQEIKANEALRDIIDNHEHLTSADCADIARGVLGGGE